MDSKAVVKPAIVLLLISAIAAGILGVVSEVTAAPIAAQNEKSLNEGMQAVMPDASSFELLDADLTGTITAVYKGDNGGFVITTEPGGFGGAVKTMVGIDADGTIRSACNRSFRNSRSGCKGNRSFLLRTVHRQVRFCFRNKGWRRNCSHHKCNNYFQSSLCRCAGSS